MKNKETQTTILLIEDRPEDAELTIAAFREAEPKWNFKLVRDGLHASQYIQNLIATKESIPDLILLDLNLPRKNGRDLLSEIRKDPLLKEIPVIVITGSRSEDDIEACHKYGASSFVFKPENWDQYRSMVIFVREFLKTHTGFPPVWVNTLGHNANSKEKAPLINATEHLLKAKGAVTNAQKGFGWYEVIVVSLNLKYAWESLTAFGKEEIRSETGLHHQVTIDTPWYTSKLDAIEKELISLEGKVADLIYEMESFSKSKKTTQTKWLENELVKMIGDLRSIIYQETEMIMHQYVDLGQAG